MLVPDLDYEVGIRALLARHQDLQISPITFGLVRHPHRDPGVRTRAHDLLRPLCRGTARALVLLDYQGCGAHSPPPDLELEIELRLRQNGWEGDRARVVVVDPELEIWLWVRSPLLGQLLGWEAGALFEWLETEALWPRGSPKPPSPKRAFRSAIHRAGRSPSASMFKTAAERIDFRGCEDRAFLRLLGALRAWFPP